MVNSIEERSIDKFNCINCWVEMFDLCTADRCPLTVLGTVAVCFPQELHCYGLYWVYCDVWGVLPRWWSCQWALKWVTTSISTGWSTSSSWSSPRPPNLPQLVKAELYSVPHCTCSFVLRLTSTYMGTNSKSYSVP